MPLVATPNSSSRPSALRAIARGGPGRRAAGAASRGAPSAATMAVARIAMSKRRIARMTLHWVRQLYGDRARRALLESGPNEWSRFVAAGRGAPHGAPRPGDALPAGGGAGR